ncbi:MAG: endo alpha-1,4 polygalactosaminidase, partial [Actinomycetes bacterium]
LEVAAQAHARGLSVGMKNGVEVVDADTVAAFDWALNEECFQYHECGAYDPFIAGGKAVFNVEYVGRMSSYCPKAVERQFSTLKKRLALGAWRKVCQAG